MVSGVTLLLVRLDFISQPAGQPAVFAGVSACQKTELSDAAVQLKLLKHK